METKMLEIRDRGTKVLVLAISTNRVDPKEDLFWMVEGFGPDDVIVVRCERQEAHYDPFAWSDARTMRNAHLYIKEHFDEIPNFSVVDVEYILKETNEPKQTETWTLENFVTCGGILLGNKKP